MIAMESFMRSTILLLSICLNSYTIQSFSFVSQSRNGNNIITHTSLYSTAQVPPQQRAAESESSNTDIINYNHQNSDEVLNGKQLHSNDNSDNDYTKVIDFGNVQNKSSKSEVALREAKESYILKIKDNQHNNENGIIINNQDRLMGINDMVVKEVGREIGNFAQDKTELIQECAKYLRSQGNAKKLFSSSNADDGTILQLEKENEYKLLLEEAYKESGLITESFAKTFYLGTQLLPNLDAQRAIWAIYVWCRRTDEIVDAERNLGSDELNNKAMLEDLSIWEYRLERLWEHGDVIDVLDLPLLHTRINYPTMSIQPYLDMIRGMLMDIKGLGVDKYNQFDHLHLYCYRVAGTVGLMSLPVFGCAKNITEDIAKEPALSLGVAFQLTNILRDVGEDAQERNRIYLPQDDMDKFGITNEQIYSKKITKSYKAFMKYQIARTRNYYQKALSGVPMLSDV